MKLEEIIAQLSAFLKDIGDRGAEGETEIVLTVDTAREILEHLTDWFAHKVKTEHDKPKQGRNPGYRSRFEESGAGPHKTHTFNFGNTSFAEEEMRKVFEEMGKVFEEMNAHFKNAGFDPGGPYGHGFYGYHDDLYGAAQQEKRRQEEEARRQHYQQQQQGHRRRRSGNTRPWHEVLGVAPGADKATIRAAYRKLAHRYHPDKGGSTERMAEINAAKDEALG